MYVMRRSRLALCTLALLGVLATPAWAADSTPQVAASAGADAPMGTAGGHQVIAISLQPGASSTQMVHVSNPHDKAALVKLRGVDVFTGASMGFGFTAVTESVHADGGWVSVPTSELTLGPGESRDVPFTINVPADARPGQHFAGVAIYTPVTTPNVTQPNGKVAVQMVIQPQRVIITKIDLPGQVSPQLTVTGARPVATTDGVALAVSVANQGTALASGSGVITVPSTSLRYEFNIEAFVPGTTAEVLVPWTKTVTPGQHDVQAQLIYDGDRSATWSGTIDVSGQTESQLRDDLIAKTPVSEVAAPSSSTSIWVWLAAAAAIGLVGFVIARLISRSTVTVTMPTPVVDDAEEMLRYRGAAQGAVDASQRIAAAVPVKKQRRVRPTVSSSGNDRTD
jgi:hypothetical protein